jgi:hypothetical protein
LVLEVDCAGLPSLDQAMLDSPDLGVPRPVAIKSDGNEHLQLTLNLEGVRLYAMVAKA